MKYSIIDLPDVRLLEEEETREYIKAAQQGDNEALDKLVNHNLRLVLKVTYRFKNTEHDLQDLFQTGVIGLIKAVRGFDLNRGVKFSTYAVSRIIGEIRLFLRDEGMVKVSRSLKKIAREIKQKEEELKKKQNRAPTLNELVEETGFSREKIINALEANKDPTSIDQTIYEGDGNKIFLKDSLEDDNNGEEITDTDKLNLVDLLRQLDERSRLIIFLRYFHDRTQQEVGDEIGISQVQVSRLEKKILKKLKEEYNTR